MTTATVDDGVMRTADGTPLKVSLRRAMRRNQVKALLLIAPLFLFIGITFLYPIAEMTLRSVDNWQVPTILHRTVAAFAQHWDGTGLPPEPVFAAMVEDLKEGAASRAIGKVATRLNYERPGMRGLIMKSQRRARRIADGPYTEALIGIDKKWGDPETWQTIHNVRGSLTASYYLAAIDLQYAPSGDIQAVPEYRQIYVMLFGRTLWLSVLITGLCILLGFPIAYLMATLPLRISNLLMIMVLLPFWTSLLVRTTAWIAMLQTQGVVNDILVAINILSDDERLQLMHNQWGTIVAMTHILLPFMVLPLYSVMKTIPPGYMRAARSLGATPLVAFWRVYVPQTVSGIGAGSILVFILAIGYYITPALVGGTSGQLISNEIARHMQQSLNWGLAAALGAILLAGVLALYLLYNRLVGIDKMKLG